MSAELLEGHDPPEDIEALRQADLLLIIALLVFCALGIALTLRFPVYDQRPATWPGWLPLLLFIGLIGMAIHMFVTVHVRRPRHRDLGELYHRCQNGLWKPEFHRGLLILALMAVYVSLLLPRLPYLLSTTVFVFGSILAFQAAPWWLAALVAAGNSLTLYVIFAKMYQIPLP